MNKNRLLLLPLIALLSAFPPLSTDMYLPAIPLLQKIWQQPLSIINLTLVGFFISYCICLLFYGPLSDRFGRRRPLLTGIGIYIAASFLCAVSNNVASLIIFRLLQAAGAASSSVLALAITKDAYKGHEREKILAYVGVIMALAPMLSPVLGGWVMTWFSWRVIFVIQGGIGAIAWIGVFRMPETLKTVSATNILQTAGIYIQLIKNRQYIGIAVLMSMVVLPHFAFIGGSADIYITRFGLSEKAFGYFFAANAAAIMAGSFACSRLLSKIESKHILTISFAGIFVGGMGMVFPWTSGPWSLGIPMAIASFAFGLSRPPSNNLVLEQVDQNAGAASSLLIFIYFMTGAFSMWLISLNWTDKIQIIGILGLLSGGVVLSMWLLISKTIAVKQI